MNTKKYFGAILATICSIGVSLSIHPLAFPLAIIGILIFIDGSEEQVVKKTVQCIQKNKTFEEIRDEEKQQFEAEVTRY